MWYYITQEARLETQGRTLGTVGSTIVAEVLYGLIKADPSSCLYHKSHWKPDMQRTASDRSATGRTPPQ